MTETNDAVPNAALLSKISAMIAAQTAGKPSGFTSDDLNHVYMDLVQGKVCEKSNELLVKMIGENWSESYEPDDGSGYDEGRDMAVAASIEDIDMDDPASSVAALASALMVACRELGWMETSRAAHEAWFHAGVDD